MSLRFLLMMLFLSVGFFQKATAQEVAVKTNGLYWMTTTLNAGVEVGLSRKVTLELTGAYNPWTFKDNKKLRFWLAEPEAK